MARPKKTTPTVVIKACLPEDLAAKVKLICYSDVEGKIPQGALQEFFTNAVEGYVKPKKIEGEPVCGSSCKCCQHVKEC